MFKNLILRYKNFYNYKIKKLLYLKNKSSNVIDINWDKIHHNRIGLINYLINTFKYESYLEIGCQNNFMFDSIFINKKIGVDPISGGNIRLTSDEFFNQNDKKFDIIFIDGLHEYKQIKKDLINSLNCINYPGWIIIHDLCPRNWEEEHVPRISSNWNGDIWKISFNIINNTNLKFKLLFIDQGIGLIYVDKEYKNLNLDNFNPQEINFDYFFNNYKKIPSIEHDNIIKEIENLIN